MGKRRVDENKCDRCGRLVWQTYAVPMDVMVQLRIRKWCAGCRDKHREEAEGGES